MALRLGPSLDPSPSPSPGASSSPSPRPSIEPAAAGRRRLAAVPDAAEGLGPRALPFPTERALLLRVALPLASQRQRQAAVGFAVEDRIAEPIEAVHVALGPALGPGEYLAAVVGRAEMEVWAPRARAGRLRLVPDVLGLPVPPAGGWSVRVIAGRALVREACGTGFATRADSLETFWRAAERPQIVLFGGRLPEALLPAATGLMPAGAAQAAAQFDLLQGAFAPPDGAAARGLRRLAAVAAVGLAAHGAILAVETMALQRIAEAREGALRAAIAARAPGLPPDLPLDAALRQAMPEARARGGFLAGFAEVAAVLEPHADVLAVRSLVYDAGDDSLTLLIEGPDLTTLQRVEAEIGAAGLAVAAGAASTRDGGAEVRFVIGGAGS